MASVPLAWWSGWLSMGWLYVVGFAIGTVHTIAGSAAQIVLTQVVPRERLVEAHAKNALAGSGAEVAGPGLAGALIKASARRSRCSSTRVLLAVSALILRGVPIRETPSADCEGRHAKFWADSRPACTSSPAIACWSRWRGRGRLADVSLRRADRADPVRDRILGLSEQAIGLCYIGDGRRHDLASLFGNRISRRSGPARAWCSASRSAASAGCCRAGAGEHVRRGGLHRDADDVPTGAVLIFINFLALRQSVTPAPLLGRMTSTMRWLTLCPPGRGRCSAAGSASIGLRTSLAVPAAALLLAVAAMRLG